MMEKMHYKTAVIGGGISGLASAYYLLREAKASGIPAQVTVFERDNRVGGKITTENVNGFTIEGGPDCFIRQKPWAGELIRELGIADQLMGTNDDRRKVFVVNRGKLTPLPDGVMLIVPTRIWPFVTSPLISWPGKIRMGMDLFIPAHKNGGDESVASFVKRRLGNEALEKIAEPLLSGIHVSDPEEQSLMATFPRFRNLEEKYGNLIFGMLEARKAARQYSKGAYSNGGIHSVFVTLKDGMNKLIDTLHEEITCLEGRVVTNTSISNIERDGNCYRLHAGRGEIFSADAVILATPASVSALLIQKMTPELSQGLKSIDYISTATMSLAYRQEDVGDALEGFGLVVPRSEKRHVSAITWTSTKFSHRVPDEYAMIRCFLGGPGREEDVVLDDETLLGFVKTEIHDLMGISAEPVLTKVFRWEKAHPQYTLGHLDRLDEINHLCDRLPGLYLTGSSYGGIGIPDCVRQGKESAQKAISYLESIQGYGMERVNN